MSARAQELIVEYYKDLRADDAQGVGRNSYRITVRQLESMIRLSEAIARANCVDEITPAFVTEAYKLLKQSIIHVEKDDVEMEDDEEDEIPTEEPVEEPVVKKEKTKVQYDKYVQMMNLIVRRLDEDERTGGQGIERDELIMWYLEQVEEHISTEEEHHKEAELVRKVLKRLKKVQFGFIIADPRTIILWRFVVMRIWRKRCRSTTQRKLYMCCTRIVMLKVSVEWLVTHRSLDRSIGCILWGQT
jgi:DNA replication licensing factor MCM6